jgi:hypothetical protein
MAGYYHICPNINLSGLSGDAGILWGQKSDDFGDFCGAIYFNTSDQLVLSGHSSTVYSTSSDNLFSVESQAGPALVLKADDGVVDDTRPEMTLYGDLSVTGCIYGTTSSVTVSTDNGICGGGSLSASRNFALSGQASNLHNATFSNGDLLAKDSSGTFVGVASSTFDHSDTSSLSGVYSNTGNNFIQSLTVDGFGHITGMSSGTATSGASAQDPHPTQDAITCTLSAGSVLQDIAVNTLGHVTSVGTVDLDGRYYTEAEVNTLLGNYCQTHSHSEYDSCAGSHTQTTVSSNSANWNNTYTNVAANSASWDNCATSSHVHSQYLVNNADDTFTGNLTVTGNVTATQLYEGSNRVCTAAYPTNNSQLANSCNYTTCQGDITEVVAGTELSGGGASGAVTINHDNISRGDTTSGYTVCHLGTFTVVDSLTSNARGHVTGINTKTVTISAGGSEKATATTLGIVKLASDTVQTVLANTVTATANRTYGVQFNSDDQMVVNIPWLNVAQGNCMSVTSTDANTLTINHADTSSQTGISCSPRTYISSVTLDSYGHVTGLGTASELVHSGAQNYIPIWTSNTVLGQSCLCQSGTTVIAKNDLTVNGSVGIGNTNPQGALDLGNATGGKSIVWGGSSGTAHYTSIWSEYSSGSLVLAGGLKSSTTNEDFIYPYTGTYGYAAIELDSFHDDGIIFYTDADAARTAGAVATKQERMRINTLGNVGVGTTNPNQKLTVTGNISASGTVYDGTSNSSQWNQAYNNYITGVGVSGTTTKTITLTQRDGGTVTDTFIDNDTIYDPWSLSASDTAGCFTVSSGNAVSLAGGTNIEICRNSGIITIDNTLAQSTNSTLGLVKIGYTENNKNYPVELSSGQMFVNVPWTDNNDNTTYSIFAGGDSSNACLVLDPSTGTDDCVVLAGGNGISIACTNADTITVNHSNTSNQADATNTGNSFIQSLTLDEFGHITGISSGTASAGTSGLSAESHPTQDAITCTLSAGNVLQDIAVNTLGHVTAVGSVDLDNRYYTETEVNNLLPVAATATTLGIVKLASDNNAGAFETISTVSNRTYGVQFNNDTNQQLVVNVPWVDTDTTYTQGLTTETGGVKVLLTPSSGSASSYCIIGANETTVSVAGCVITIDTDLSNYSTTSHNHTLDSLSSVTITSNSNGEILRWNGSEWVNNTLAEAGIQSAGSFAAASHNHNDLYYLKSEMQSLTATATGYGLSANGRAFGVDTSVLDARYIDNTNNYLTGGSFNNDQLTLGVNNLSNVTVDLGGYNYNCLTNKPTTGSGTVTSVSLTAGSLIDIVGGPITTSGNIGVHVDLSELPDMTGDMTCTEDELVVLDNSVQKRKSINEIKLSCFCNDSQWTSCQGDITEVVAGTELSGGGATGSVTINHDNISRSNTTSGCTVCHLGSFTVVDSVSSNARGHITGINTKTVTISADSGSGSGSGINKATATTLGIVKLASDTDQTVAANTVTATANRTYGVQFNSADQMVVNVPWVDTDTDTTYSFAASNNCIVLTPSSGSADCVVLESGNCMSVVGTNANTLTINHADTSSQTSVSCSSRRYISAVTLDSFGHVTGLDTATEPNEAQSGTQNYIPIWSNNSTLGNSCLCQSGTTVIAKNDLNVNGSVGIGNVNPNQKLTVTGNISASGTVYDGTSNSSQWKQAYNNYITGIGVTGTTTKTITLTQRDGGTVATTFTDIDNDIVYNGWNLYTDTTCRGTIISDEQVRFCGGTDISLGYTATNNVITFNHDSISRTNTSNSCNANFEDSFTVIDSITSSAQGHITAVNTKTVTLPDETPHPTHTASTCLCGGISFLADITVNNCGHVTSLKFEDIRAGTTAQTGVVELATDNEVCLSSSTTKVITPSNLKCITKLGTIGTGVWQGTAIADAYIASASDWNSCATSGHVHSQYLLNTTDTFTGNLTVTGNVTAAQLYEGSNRVCTSSYPTVSDATICISGGTALGGGGDFTLNQSGNETITINHDNITRTNNSSTASPGYAGTFTVIDSITSSTQGHITAVNTKTVTLPSVDDTNTTYTLNAIDGSGDVTIRLTGTDSSTDDVILCGSSGVSINSSGDIVTIAGPNLSSYCQTHSHSEYASCAEGHTQTTVASNSANWNNAYTNVAANSADWNNAYTNVAANSADWNSCAETNHTHAIACVTGLQTALDSKQACLTFGIANTNAVCINSASVADNEYARFTASGLESRSVSEVRSDIGLGSIYNCASTDFDKYTGWVLYTDTTCRGTITSAEEVRFCGGNCVDLSYAATNNVITINHADTSTLNGASNNSGNVFIQDLTFDSYGHVTAIGTGTSTHSDTTYGISSVDVAGTAEVKLRLTDSGSGTDDVTICATQNLTINSTGDVISITGPNLSSYCQSHTHSQYLLNTTDTFTGNLTVTGNVTAAQLYEGSSRVCTAPYPTNTNQLTNGCGFTDCTGTITGITFTVGPGLDVTGSPITTSGTVNLSLDLSEFPNMDVALDGAADRIIILDSGSEKSKLICDINLGEFCNNLGWNNYSHPPLTSISVDNSNGTVLQDIAVNSLGHVTSVASVNLDNRYYTETEVDNLITTAVDDLVNAAPAALDTLDELANALGDDANFATTITTSIASKQCTLTFGIADTNTVCINSADVADNEYARFTASGLESRTIGEVRDDIGVGDGKLTQKNFTNTLKTKLDGIAASANNYSLPVATAAVLGGIELESDTVQSVAANDVTAVAGRTYGIQLNSANQAVVNVPWDTITPDVTATTDGAKLQFTGIGGAQVGVGSECDIEIKGTGATTVTSDGTSITISSTDNNDTYSQASTGALGLVELATNAEVTTGTDSIRAITPSNLESITKLGQIGVGTWQGSAIADDYIQSASVWNTCATSGHVHSQYLVNNADDTFTGNLTVTVNVTAAQLYEGSSRVCTAAYPTVPGAASATTLGLVKLISNTQQACAANSVSGVTNRTYGLQLNSSNQLVVNVPWSNTNNYADSLTFSSGTLTVGRSGTLGDLTVSLDSRYYTETEVDNLITTGIADTNTVCINSTSVANNDYAKFTSSGLSGRSIGEVRDDIGVGDGKLTQKNFTTTLKTKLDGIADSANNYSLPVATATELGGIELYSNTVQSVGATGPSSTANRTYGIQLNSAGQAVVNVPWTDNNTTVTPDVVDTTNGAGIKISGIVGVGSECTIDIVGVDDMEVNVSTTAGTLEISSTKATNAEVTAASINTKPITPANLTSITKLGTIETGVWQGTAIADTYISSASNWNNAYTNVAANSADWNTCATSSHVHSQYLVNNADDTFTGNLTVTVNVTAAQLYEGSSRVCTAAYPTVPGAASATALGLVKLISNTQQACAANSVSGVTNRTYGLQLNSSNQLVVNVPWSDTNDNTTYSLATSTTLGLVKIGYTENDKNYPVELSSSKMYVNVPWTDNNTTYSAATTSALGLVKLESAAVQSCAANAITETGGRTYGVQFNSSNQLVVNVPWSDTDTNTTYSLATSTTQGLVKIGYTESGKNYPVELSSGKMYVNVPWSDTNTNTNNYADSASFNSSDGNLTIGRSGTLGDLTVCLDGRYCTSDNNTTYTAGNGITLGQVVANQFRVYAANGLEAVSTGIVMTAASLASLALADTACQSSDYRSKTCIEEYNTGYSSVKNVNAFKYIYKEDETEETHFGMMAHELQESGVEYGIGGTKDEVDEDGEPIYQKVNLIKLVPTLWSALNAAINKIEDLESRIDKMELQSDT